MNVLKIPTGEEDKQRALRSLDSLRTCSEFQLFMDLVGRPTKNIMQDALAVMNPDTFDLTRYQGAVQLLNDLESISNDGRGGPERRTNNADHNRPTGGNSERR